MHDILEIHITTGFEYKGRLFGFYKKKLYRLPYRHKLRYYPFKEIPFKNNHYRLCRDKVGIAKIKTRLTSIDFKTKIYLESELPF